MIEFDLYKEEEELSPYVIPTLRRIFPTLIAKELINVHPNTTSTGHHRMKLISSRLSIYD